MAAAHTQDEHTKLVEGIAILAVAIALAVIAVLLWRYRTPCLRRLKCQTTPTSRKGSSSSFITTMPQQLQQQALSWSCAVGAWAQWWCRRCGGNLANANGDTGSSEAMEPELSANGNGNGGTAAPCISPRPNATKDDAAAGGGVWGGNAMRVLRQRFSGGAAGSSGYTSTAVHGSIIDREDIEMQALLPRKRSSGSGRSAHASRATEATTAEVATAAVTSVMAAAAAAGRTGPVMEEAPAAITFEAISRTGLANAGPRARHLWWPVLPKRATSPSVRIVYRSGVCQTTSIAAAAAGGAGSDDHFLTISPSAATHQDHVMMFQDACIKSGHDAHAVSINKVDGGDVSATEPFGCTTMCLLPPPNTVPCFSGSRECDWNIPPCTGSGVTTTRLASTVRLILWATASTFPFLTYFPVLPDLIVTLLLHDVLPEDAFAIVFAVVSNPAAHFGTPSQPRAHIAEALRCQSLLTQRCPRLARHLASHGVCMHAVYLRWASRLFRGVIVPALQARVTDLYLLGGAEWLVRCFVAAWSWHESVLLQETSCHAILEKMRRRMIDMKDGSRSDGTHWLRRARELSIVKQANSCREGGLFSSLGTARQLHHPNLIRVVGYSALVNARDCFALWRWLPDEFRILCPKLVYSSASHGYSMATLLEKSRHCDNVIVLVGARSSSVDRRTGGNESVGKHQNQNQHEQKPSGEDGVVSVFGAFVPNVQLGPKGTKRTLYDKRCFVFSLAPTHGVFFTRSFVARGRQRPEQVTSNEVEPSGPMDDEVTLLASAEEGFAIGDASGAAFSLNARLAQGMSQATKTFSNESLLGSTLSIGRHAVGDACDASESAGFSSSASYLQYFSVCEVEVLSLTMPV